MGATKVNLTSRGRKLIENFPRFEPIRRKDPRYFNKQVRAIDRAAELSRLHIRPRSSS